MEISRKAAAVLTVLVLAAAACGVDDGGEVRLVNGGGSVSGSASASGSGSASDTGSASASASGSASASVTASASGTGSASASGAASSDAEPPPEPQEASEEDTEAVLQAYRVVFDSRVPFDEKVPYLEDAEQLRDVFERYVNAAQMFGGIYLDPTAVEIDGDTAEVTYNVMFGEQAAYSDLAGDAVRIDGVWSVTRARFCAFMSSARVSCPSPSG